MLRTYRAPGLSRRARIRHYLADVIDTLALRYGPELARDVLAELARRPSH